MPANPNATPGRSTATILVVEDDGAVREAVVWILRLMGYDTREAADGPAALEILEHDAGIRLMFSDVVMPKGMSGIELAQEVRRRQPGLKILLTTGYSAADIDRSPLGRNAIRVITKPYTNDDLDRTLQEILAEQP
jgi:CheY-like chemotaxis protein